MEAFFFFWQDAFNSKNPKIQKSKIQKEKHSEGVHKALDAMRHTKPEPDKIGLLSLDMKVSIQWMGDVICRDGLSKSKMMPRAVSANTR